MEMGKGEAKRMFGIFGNVLEGGGREEMSLPRQTSDYYTDPSQM